VAVTSKIKSHLTSTGCKQQPLSSLLVLLSLLLANYITDLGCLANEGAWIKTPDKKGSTELSSVYG